MSYASVVGGIELRSVRRRATISAEISRFEESYQLTELRDIMVIDADVSFLIVVVSALFVEACDEGLEKLAPAKEEAGLTLSTVKRKYIAVA